MQFIDKLAVVHEGRVLLVYPHMFCRPLKWKKAWNTLRKYRKPITVYVYDGPVCSVHHMNGGGHNYMVYYLGDGQMYQLHHHSTLLPM